MFSVEMHGPFLDSKHSSLCLAYLLYDGLIDSITNPKSRVVPKAQAYCPHTVSPPSVRRTQTTCTQATSNPHLPRASVGVLLVDRSAAGASIQVVGSQPRLVPFIYVLGCATTPFEYANSTNHPVVEPAHAAGQTGLVSGRGRQSVGPIVLDSLSTPLREAPHGL